MKMSREIGDPGTGELFNENFIARLRERHQRQKNRVLAASGNDDAIDWRVEPRPSDPRRTRGAIVPSASVMLIPENACARGAWYRGGKPIRELFHIRKGHQRVDGEIQHALLRSFDI